MASDFPLAIALYKNAAAKGDANAEYRLGYMYLHGAGVPQHYGQAWSWFQKAADMDPAWGKPLYKLGLCALKQGDKQGATKLMDQAIAVDPVSPEAALAKATLDSLNK